jgi:hypothetical protein
VTYVYRAEVLEALLEHGVRPTATTPPGLARRFVRDLYCYQLRTLRDRLLRNEFPKREYAGRVLELRDRYRILALLPRQFVEGP